MDTLKRDDLLVLLRGESLAVQASASGKGARQAAVVGMVVTDNFGVFFDTVDDSRNTPNLRVNPKIVLLIRGMTWGHERTVCSTKVLLTNPAAASSNACRSSYFVRCARTGGNDRRGPA